MSQHNLDKDNRLAEFADQVLHGKTIQPASSSDLDLLRLEETILRLKHTFPADTPDAAKTKQMLARLKARIKREEEAAANASFWKKLLNFHVNPQIGMIFTAAAMFILALVTMPTLVEPSGGEAFTGAASNSSNLFNVLIGGAALIAAFVVYWFFRKR